MRARTFLRSAAGRIGMDPGNLSKLARKYGVPIDDEAALIRLGTGHQRDSASRGRDGLAERPCPVFAEFHSRVVKERKAVLELVAQLLRHKTLFRGFGMALADALQPIWKVPWNGSDALILTPAQVATIRAMFDGDMDGATERFRKDQHAELEFLEELMPGRFGPLPPPPDACE